MIVGKRILKYNCCLISFKSIHQGSLHGNADNSEIQEQNYQSKCEHYTILGTANNVCILTQNTVKFRF